MKLGPRYCRTCGSRILLKHICHNCGNDPLQGDNYCYDCGSLTPDEASCSNCGTSYKSKLPVPKSLLIAGGFMVIIAAIILITQTEPSDKSAIINNEGITADTEVNSSLSAEPIHSPATIVTPAADTSNNRNNMDTTQTAEPIDSIKTIETNVFSSAEVKSYRPRCTFFEKKQKSQVLFFTSSGSAFIKVNGTVYTLKRTRKKTDIETFSGDNYEATITIEGLSGSDKEWLATGTLLVKDLLQNSSVKRRVYSTCISL